VAIAFGLATRLLAGYMRHVADRAITDQFRAAEAIADGRTPPKWVAEINRHTNRRSAVWPLRRDVPGTELALQRIDKLYGFFEDAPFFESNEARELLLKQLLETHQRWEKMAWQEIAAERDGRASREEAAAGVDGA
jgi:hypothetical protein